MNDANKVGQLLRDRGWCQGDYERPTGEMCLSKAISEVDPAGHLYRVFVEAIAQTFPKREGWAGLVVRFNDHEDTTEDDIKKVITRASKLLIKEDRDERDRKRAGDAGDEGVDEGVVG